jgi:hypothetical protein
MNKTSVSYIIIFAIIILLSIIGYNWHSKQLEAIRREEIAKSDGVIQELTKLLNEREIIATGLRKSIDSAKVLLNDRDTIIVYKSYEKNINHISTLGSDAHLELLASRLSKIN